MNGMTPDVDKLEKSVDRLSLPEQEKHSTPSPQSLIASEEVMQTRWR